MGGDSCLRCCTRQLPLDYDTWYCIFQKLNSLIDQNSFGLTCVTFRNIQNSTSRRCLKIRCSNNNSIIDSFIIDKLLNRHSKLEKLTLGCYGCPHLTYSCLTPLLKYGSTLRSLNLDHCNSIRETQLKLIASACPLLSVISLTITSITDGGLQVLSKSCKYLNEVNLFGCYNITDNGIYFLIQNCHQLRALIISQCGLIHGVGFRECSPTLACLEAFNCDLDSKAVSRIVSGGGLEYLNLGTYGSRGSTVLEPIGLGFASKLKCLNIARCSLVDDDVIIKISRGCPLLQEWNLTGCNMIWIPGWKSIGKYCQNLETLHVGYCIGRGLLYVGAGCKRLSVIVIEENQNTSEIIGLFKLQREDVEIKTKVPWHDARSRVFKTYEKYRAG
ncbi:F-box/LRR-repeat protein 12-like [Rutidosis leptorrhynchoides]|uniref:F-box/LRR-repeat protein 12-like n=1 Tax=Rutidosis leptorrhynchoides TaxID=125765 RepID=UPI003A99D204